MSADWLWLFLWLPLLAGIAALVVAPQARFWVGLAGTMGVLMASLWLWGTVARADPISSTVSALPPPFAIAVVADKLAAILLALTALLFFVSLVYTRYEPAGDGKHPYFYPLFQFLLLGLNGIYLAADLFNLYVWFEVQLIASFGMLVLRRERRRIEGAVKYLTLNLIASTLLLTAAGTLYALTGTLNLAAMAQALATVDRTGAADAAAMLLLLAFGIKSALFPLFFWLPASYHTLPVSVGAFFAGIMSKVGIYAMMRLFTLVFPGYLQQHATLVLSIAGLTMVSGVLGAIAQQDIRRLLSFHIISQIGYLLMGMALAGSAGLAASIFFLVHVAIAKSALFFASGMTERMTGTNDLARMGGLAYRSSWLATLFLLAAFSLAGFPPLSGFWAKLLILRAGFSSEAYVVAGVAVAVSLLTLYSMSKVWLEGFWKPAPEHMALAPPLHADWIPLGTLTAFIVLLGVFAEPGMRLATHAAEELLARRPYLDAVLGGK